jgi:hypothetical protein
MSRDHKVEATRQFVLSVCVIAGAIAAFQMPMLKGLGSTSVAFAAVSSSIACYLIAILLGILHLVLLYHEALYADKSGASDASSGDILLPLKILMKFLWGLFPAPSQVSITSLIKIISPYFCVRGQFSLMIFGLLFSFGLSISLSFLVLRVYGIDK